MRSHPIVRAMRRRRHQEDGYVLATVVALGFIVVMTVTAIFTVNLVNIEGMRRSSGQAAGRAEGQSLFDRAFSQLQTGSNPDVSDNRKLNVEGTSGTPATWKWYEVAGNGKYGICTDATKVCVHYAWQAAPSST
ncbi:MAG: hypothetical protein ACOYN3_10305, partial [Acidimicrobiia bacterium]